MDRDDDSHLRPNFRGRENHTRYDEELGCDTIIYFLSSDVNHATHLL